MVVLFLLKTRPSAVSSSSLEGTTTNPFPLSRGAVGEAVPTIAKGTTSIGRVEVGVGRF